MYFNWTETHQRVFEYIKQCIHSIEGLKLPDFNTPFYVETDASIHSLDAVLLNYE